eukprot:8854553-Lingulodinium_polyedra.AAC.1
MQTHARVRAPTHARAYAHAPGCAWQSHGAAWHGMIRARVAWHGASVIGVRALACARREDACPLA